MCLSNAGIPPIQAAMHNAKDLTKTSIPVAVPRRNCVDSISDCGGRSGALTVSFQGWERLVLLWVELVRPLGGSLLNETGESWRPV
jgi:hypothetical protein